MTGSTYDAHIQKTLCKEPHNESGNAKTKIRGINGRSTSLGKSVKEIEQGMLLALQ